MKCIHTHTHKTNTCTQYKITPMLKNRMNKHFLIDKSTIIDVIEKYATDLSSLEM